MIKDVYFEAPNKEKIHATFYFRKGKPIVIFCHGMPGMNKNQAIAQALYDADFSVLVPEFRGVGKSEGKFTIKNAIEDVEACIYFAKEQEVDAEKIGLLGYSIGGLYAAFVAGIRNDISALILLELLVFAHKTWKEIPNVSEFLQEILKTVRFEPEEFMKELAIADEQMSPLETAKQINCPILLIHGRQDTVISIGQALQFNDAARKAKKNIEFFKADIDHEINGKERGITIRKIVDFCGKTLARETEANIGG